jgi:hypothetical protein
MGIIELQVASSTITGAASMRPTTGLGFNSPTWTHLTLCLPRDILTGIEAPQDHPNNRRFTRILAVS